MNLVYRFLKFLIPITFIIFQIARGGSINLMLRPAPRITQEKVRLNLMKLDKKSPAQIGKKLFKNGFKQFLPQLGGFATLYGGYVDYSDTDGTISFPMLQSEQKIYLVITPNIELFYISGKTISHRIFLTNVPAEIYLFERKENSDKTLYWKVSKTKKPADNSVDPLSIVLLTKPKNIYVPTGDFITTKNSNIVLPNVYVVGNMTSVNAILNFLDIRRFFEQIDKKDKPEKETIIQKMIQNI